MNQSKCQFSGTGQTNNRIRAAQPNHNEQTITGLLTSRIETRNKNNQTYYYGFFQIPHQSQEIPVIFKTKPGLKKDSQVELVGQWAQSNNSRPSFTFSHYQLLKEPEPLTLQSLQIQIKNLLSSA
jgi:hypothetical protein